MTLLDHLPSLRRAAAQRIDGDAWPRTTVVDELGRLCIGGIALTDAAAEYGTAIHVVDETDLRHRLRARHTESRELVPVVSASSLPTTVMRWVDEEGLGMALHSGRELAAANAAGVTPARMVMHVAGLDCDELTVCAHAVPGRIVVDSPMDVAYLSCSARPGQRVLVRVIGTGPDPHTVERVVHHPDLELVGLHCRATDDVDGAIRALMTSMDDVRHRHGLLLTEIGLTVDAYVDDLGAAVDDALDAACAAFRFPRPRVVVEDRRQLLRPSVVTAYRVTSVVAPPTGPRVVVVDGPLTDFAKGPVVLANRHPLSVTERVTVRGVGAETTRDVDLPCDVHPGDVLAVASEDLDTGAAVSVRDGLLHSMIRRSTIDDELARDVGFSACRGDHQH